MVQQNQQNQQNQQQTDKDIDRIVLVTMSKKERRLLLYGLLAFGLLDIVVTAVILLQTL